ncbi:MAG: hypothetical protein KDA25_13520 [Phycisphaerales bacterium]|nr:hypothetical protein [Phycisphaerales bacterium]
MATKNGTTKKTAKKARTAKGAKPATKKTGAKPVRAKKPAASTPTAAPVAEVAAPATTPAPKARSGTRAKRGGDGANAKATVPAKAPAKPKRTSLLDAAAAILGKSPEPMSAKDLAERAIAAGWSGTGKTPHATLYAAMIREIAKKGDAARFVKVERGRFVTKAV